MIYTSLTKKALNIAYKAHEGQLDQSGIPYIFHPYHVAEQMEDEITTCIALLHDVMEDTAVTDEELSEEFPEEVMVPLRLLNHDSAEPYADYIRRIKTNPTAVKVKLADIAHNMDLSRVADTDVSKEQLEHWHRKYQNALAILNE